ncbi:type II toxin-antitoxin system RelE/ParE family toxin [Ruminococcus sp.]|uniref:type II toxin-antitoxin system RelE/ParE family toxin n=1 Tax=Ruminococcus sp. TaxID=41978 RepID=UPI0038630E40
MFEIIFYETEDSHKPVIDFLNSLDTKMRVKALREIQLLKEFGYTLREPNSKALQDGLFELRIKQGNNISRIIYFFFINNKIVMTNGFMKKTQKTPKAEIEKAKKYKDDFERRNKNG